MNIKPLIYLIVIFLISCEKYKKKSELQTQEKIIYESQICDNSFVGESIKMIDSTKINMLNIEKEIDISSLKKLEGIKENGKYYSDLYYYASIKNPECVYLLIDKSTFPNKIFLSFLNNNALANNLTLSYNEDYPDGHFIKYSEINGNTIITYDILTFLDEYVDKNNFSYAIDSVSVTYKIENSTTRIISKDSIRKYEITGKIDPK